MNKSVTGCEGRLVRTFPGPSVQVESQHIKDPSFRKSLVEALTKMDMEKAPNMGELVSWEETAHPRLVTEMMMGILRGMGDDTFTPPFSPARICKHSREEVLGNTSSPWRRSSLWLLVRVSLQLTLERATPPGSLRNIYKEFIAFFMGQILDQAASEDLPHDTLFMMLARISRRLLKLGHLEAPWITSTNKILQDVRAKLDTTWDIIQTGESEMLNMDPLRSLDFVHDSCMSLETLRPYLRQVTDKPPLTDAVRAAEAEDHNPRFNRQDCLPHGEFDTKNESALLYELADFENWVACHLKDHTATGTMRSARDSFGPPQLSDGGTSTEDDFDDFTGKPTSSEAGSSVSLRSEAVPEPPTKLVRRKETVNQRSKSRY
jgi:hypothetical protein